MGITLAHLIRLLGLPGPPKEVTGVPGTPQQVMGITWNVLIDLGVLGSTPHQALAATWLAS